VDLFSDDQGIRKPFPGTLGEKFSSFAGDKRHLLRI
jgi:hypothetical protein